MLAAARGRDNARIAADLRITVDTVRKWRGRFAGRGLDGLTDLPRSGRPRRISELTRAAVVALACQLPAATGVPLSRWTGPELLAEITRAGLGRQLSVSSVLRILAGHPVKPWQYQSWICPRDPDFAVRASVILDLYQGFYQGKRLRPGDRILSVDAKPSIQARGRCRPAAPATRGKPVRAGHEYVRHGALALLAALDVHTGNVFAATPATTGIVPFMDLMSQVMSLPEYKDAPRVFVIVDNGSDHRGQAAIKRLRDAWPNAIMIYTPVHASWLNQAEINRPWEISAVMSGSGLPGEPLEVALDAGDDAGVPGNLGVPAACGGVVAERGDVGQLGLELGDELRGGDVVVALLADVGVGAGLSGELTGAVAVRDPGLEHLGAQPFDPARG